MACPEPHWKDKFLVVGIDIGTTHSGYVWTFLSDYQADKAKIQVKTWKGEAISGKTPTCLLLKPNGSFFKFGYEAMKEYSQLVETNKHKPYRYFEKFKMALYEEKGLTLKTTIMDAEGRDFPALDVFTESIKYLRNNFLDTVQAKQSKIPDSDIFYVLTTPAIWSEKAKSFMRVAGERAGILPDHLRIALEPECAAVYVHTLLKSGQYTELSRQQRPDASLHIKFSSLGLESQQDEISPGMTYLVIDMGGGTIDITIHKIGDTGRLQELDTPSGGSWGSDRINRKFQDFVISLVGATVFEEFKQDSREAYIDWLNEVERQKRLWDGESSVNLWFPGALSKRHKKENGEDLNQSLRQSPYSAAAELKYDRLKMHKCLIEETLFNDTIDATLKHIQSVLSQFHKRPDMILLVGGFADCEVMRKRINETFCKKVDRIIYPTAEAVLAVLKGSVLYGRDPSIIDTRICRYTYGLDWNEEFDPARHPPERKEHTDDGTYCKDIFRKLIQKGDIVDSTSSSQTIEAYPRYRTQERIEFPFYRSEGSMVPKFVDEEGCFHLGTLSVELPPEDRNLDSYIKLKVKFGSTELTAEATDSTGRKCSSKFNLLQTQI